MPAQTDADTAQLQRRMVAFVRAFGLHRPDETPCGVAVPVSEAHALAVLREHGPMSQGELAGHLALTKSTVSRLVDQLQARAWVERRASEHDGRSRVVALTGTGADMASQVAQRRAERFAAVLERLPSDQRPAVLAALDALVEAAREA